MTRITYSQSIGGALFLLCLAAVPASAHVHTYVSGKGADTGDCLTPATACRTFAFAIAQTDASGEIIAIDPANYGPVTITKSISIVADGAGPAGIFINAGTAITINGGANEIINLRGLTLDGSGTADGGIFFGTPTMGGSVTITDCFIRHFKGSGIFLGTGLGVVNYYISNTVSSDNTGEGFAVGGLGSTGVVDHFTANGDNIGISVGAALKGQHDVTIVDSVLTNNVDGLQTELVGQVFARLAGSVVTRNGTGVFIGANAKVFSYGDNEINDNGTDVLGTLTPIAKR